MLTHLMMVLNFGIESPLAKNNEMKLGMNNHYLITLMGIFLTHAKIHILNM